MTSIGRVRSAGPVAEDDELSGVGQCAGRGTLREGRSLAELEPTPPLAGDRPPGHRTALTKGEGLPPPSHASGRIEARTEDRHDDVEEAGRVSHREPWRVSTKNGLDSPAETRCLVIRVTNKGARTVTINSTGWYLGKSDLTCIHNPPQSSPDQLPKKLEYGETATFILEESSVAEWSGQTLRELADYLVKEGFSDKSLKKLRAQIHTSLGHTENVVPSEQVLEELRTAMQQVSARSTMHS